MTFLRNLSIPVKLILMTATATTLALMVAGLSFFINDMRLLRASKIEQLSALGEVFALNSTAALSFGQADSANELLSSLMYYPTVSDARIVDEYGEVFASYQLDTANAAYDYGDLELGAEYTNSGLLQVNIPIIEGGERLGTLQLVDSMNDVSAMYVDYIVVTAVVVLVSLAFGLAFTYPMQRSISKPILDLATTAQMISQDTDFMIRVHRDADDEIGVLYEEFNKLMESVQNSGEQARVANAELQRLNDDLEGRVLSRTQMLETANVQLQQEMVERDLATERLKEAQNQLIETSRKAGMADVANGVLHNVGNVLNSLNVSASVVDDRVRGLALGRLQQCVDMITANESDIGTFMAESPKGQMLPKYLASLSVNLETDRTQIVDELKSLEKSVEHIKDIVRAQQSYAGSFGVVEQCSPAELMEDALQFVSDSISRHRVELIKEYGDVPNVEIEKSRLIQMLVNLIKNAKESVLIQGNDLMQVRLKIDLDENDFVRFSVSDTGVGIAPEKLTAIFSQGYTTKKDGHGFGLHASANAAKEMGGDILVESDGLGLGATLTILLPRRRKIEGKKKLDIVSNEIQISPVAVAPTASESPTVPI